MGLTKAGHKHIRIALDLWRRVQVARVGVDEGIGVFCERAIEERLARMVSGEKVGGRVVVEVGWKAPERAGVDPKKIAEVLRPVPDISERLRAEVETGSLEESVRLAEETFLPRAEPEAEHVFMDQNPLLTAAVQGMTTARYEEPVEALRDAVASPVPGYQPSDAPLDLSGIPHDGLGVLGPPDDGYRGQDRGGVGPGGPEGAVSGGQVPAGAGKPASADSPEEPREGRHPNPETVVTDLSTKRAYETMFAPRAAVTKTDEELF